MNSHAWILVLILLSSMVPGLIIFFLKESRRTLRTTLNLLGAVLKLVLVGHGQTVAINLETHEVARTAQTRQADDRPTHR